MQMIPVESTSTTSRHEKFPKLVLNMMPIEELKPVPDMVIGTLPFGLQCPADGYALVQPSTPWMITVGGGGGGLPPKVALREV